MRQPPTTVWFDGLTDVGTRRENNEDCWLAQVIGGRTLEMSPGAEPVKADMPGPPVLLLVSDGIGGAKAGEVASQMAISGVSKHLGVDRAVFADRESAQIAVLDAITHTHEAIAQRAQTAACEGMGATLSLLCINGRQAFWSQLGDSRIYVQRRGKLRQISRDHSPVGRLRQQGRITEAEARRHPLRNQIDQGLGDTGGPVMPDFGAEPVATNDVFLLCSDGLSDGLWDHEIEAILSRIRSPETLRAAVQRLIDDAKEASGRDNITAVAAWVAPSPERTKRLLSKIKGILWAKD